MTVLFQELRCIKTVIEMPPFGSFWMERGNFSNLNLFYEIKIYNER